MSRIRGARGFPLIYGSCYLVAARTGTQAQNNLVRSKTAHNKKSSEPFFFYIRHFFRGPAWLCFGSPQDAARKWKWGGVIAFHRDGILLELLLWLSVCSPTSVNKALQKDGEFILGGWSLSNFQSNFFEGHAETEHEVTYTSHLSFESVLKVQLEILNIHPLETFTIILTKWIKQEGEEATWRKDSCEREYTCNYSDLQRRALKAVPNIVSSLITRRQLLLQTVPSRRTFVQYDHDFRTTLNFDVKEVTEC